jgi:uncharacterized phiE125 gp8 family phage protein
MNGSQHLITRPTEDVVTLAEAKAQIRITNSDNDDMIAALIAAATASIDPAGGGWLGRAIRPQTWELRLNEFPRGYCGSGYHHNFRMFNEIELPYPPLISVDSFTYKDHDGIEKTLVEDTGFRVIGADSLALTRASLAPVYNGTWPASVRRDHESVKIQFTCGYEKDYGNSPPSDILPTPIKQAVLLMVKHLWGLGERNLFVSAETVDGVGSRNFVVTENAAAVMKIASEGLLSTYRIWD